jgi:hypothetical protein
MFLLLKLYSLLIFNHKSRPRNYFLIFFFFFLLENVSPNDLAVLDPIIKGRELFASECRDIYPASYIKFV